MGSQAQNANTTANETADTLQTSSAPAFVLSFGEIHYDSLLHSMPEYGAVQVKIEMLRDRYNAEINYNELNFKRLFAEFLQGQKDFPQNILLKRQRDLQETMEKCLAFRHDVDSILKTAAADMEAPVRQMLDEAIRQVGIEQGYTCIINKDTTSLPFIHPAFREDATPYIMEALHKIRNGKNN